MPDHALTLSPFARVQQLAALSTRLSLQLYNFSGSVSLSTNELNDLAGQINTLSGALRQIGSWLHDRNNIPSTAAFHDITQIVDQCHATFEEIQAIAPVNELPEPVAGGLHLAVGGSWSWDSLPRGKVLYLMGYLDTLSCTLSTMAQTFYTGQVISWSMSDPSHGTDAMMNERMGMESLAVKQQMSLARVSKLFQEYMKNKTPEISGSPSSQALLPSSEQGVHPQSLVRYQGLSESQPPLFNGEIEIHQSVRSVSPHHVDDLLQRWTNICGNWREPSTSTPPPQRRSPESRQRRLSQQATVESDTEEDAESPKMKSSKPISGYQGPVLDYADPSLRDPSLPIPVPGATARRRQQSISDFHSSWSPVSPTSANFQSRSQNNPAPSPTSSQTPSLTRTLSTLNSPIQRHPGPGSVASTQSSHASDPADALGIPYSLRLNQSCWDFVDEDLTHSNTNLSPNVGLHDPRTVTEIRESWIAAEALRERKIPFRMMKRNVGDDDRKTKIRSFYRIDRPLAHDEVASLVERSAELVGEAEAQWKERRRSSTRRPSLIRPGADSEGPRSSRQSFSNFTPVWPPMEEDLNEGWEEDERGQKDRDREREKGGERRASSSGRRRDSKSRRESESRKLDAPEREENVRERRGSSTLRGLAAGGGIAALVTGLMDAMM